MISSNMLCYHLGTVNDFHWFNAYCFQIGLFRYLIQKLCKLENVLKHFDAVMQN